MTKWICHPGDNRNTRLVPVFRRHFEAHKVVEKALLRLTAHGIYEAELNGMSVTENKFMPGLTSYYTRIQTQEYVVTALLKEGGNELLVTIGDGWWRWNNNFGYTLALWGELRILYADGSVETLSTDESWEVGLGPILRTDLQKGESYDARVEPHGWQKAALCTEHRLRAEYCRLCPDDPSEYRTRADRTPEARRRIGSGRQILHRQL